MRDKTKADKDILE